MVTQVELARTLGLDVSTVNKILNRRPGFRFRKETIRQVFQMAKRLGYDFNRIKYPHRRRYPRADSQVPSDLLIYMNGGTVLEQGAAVIRDMSPVGALLSDIQLPSESLPIKPFTVGVRPRTQDMNGELRGRVVRLETTGRVTLGIEFTEFETEIESRIGGNGNGNGKG
jgi:hypothetical protein